MSQQKKSQTMTSKYNQSYEYEGEKLTKAEKEAFAPYDIAPTLTSFRGNAKEWKACFEEWKKKQNQHPFHNRNYCVADVDNINTEKLNLILKVKKTKKIKTIWVYDGCLGNFWVLPNFAVEQSEACVKYWGEKMRYIKGSVLVRYA